LCRATPLLDRHLITSSPHHLRGTIAWITSDAYRSMIILRYTGA